MLKEIGIASRPSILRHFQLRHRLKRIGLFPRLVNPYPRLTQNGKLDGYMDLLVLVSLGTYGAVISFY